MARLVTLQDVREHPKIIIYIKKADRFLEGIGYTEHGMRHATLVAQMAQDVLRGLDYPERAVELAGIAGFIHDIGNLFRREGHEVAGAVIAERILTEMGMSTEEIADIITAVGNHEEEGGLVTTETTAALILADKADVHRHRVRNINFNVQDIHDRVNFAVEESHLIVKPQEREILLDIHIDTEISSVMDYFEIFLSRMVMSRKAAEFLRATFSLVINNTKLL